MLHSVIDMASHSGQHFAKLTLDLNSPAPASGVLGMLNVIAGSPNDYDLQLRVILGKSVLNFSFTGVENLPALVTGVRYNLAGSTMTPETHARLSVEETAASVEEHIPLSPSSEDSDSLNSDEPIDTQKKRRRKNLCHPKVRNESYEEPEAEKSSTARSNKRRRFRKARPAPGAYREPPVDGHDLFPDSSSEVEELFSQSVDAKRAPRLPPETEDQRSNSPRSSKARQRIPDFGTRHANQPQWSRTADNRPEPETQHITESRSTRAPAPKNRINTTPPLRQATFHDYFSSEKPDRTSSPTRRRWQTRISESPRIRTT